MDLFGPLEILKDLYENPKDIHFGISMLRLVHTCQSQSLFGKFIN